MLFDFFGHTIVLNREREEDIITISKHDYVRRTNIYNKYLRFSSYRRNNVQAYQWLFTFWHFVWSDGLVIIFSTHGSCLAAAKREFICFITWWQKKSMLNIFSLENLMTDYVFLTLSCSRYYNYINLGNQYISPIKFKFDSSITCRDEIYSLQ